ncbi:(Fe-S)-binding protein [Neomoorella mulderi]|uniref:Corrinoid/iron-sulfur protein large subunit n=1 Tax=Moorella mulderi DSM 14980 TaxID=1122241 RepID=A0A151B0I6_9FIRM|nr:(Fe-S)-binding protein [Moorella mulderi]KYH33421.1 corrinoid/iron-sulfur protein large subunit [Moorella mulderi DSM 14980]
MFLEKIDVTKVETCLADAEKIRLQAVLSQDIEELLPYLNTVIKNAVYNHYAKNLTFMKEFRLITLYPRKLTMAKAVNMTDALQVLDWLKDLINDTHRRQKEISPTFTKKERPTALQIYKWLPGTNCRRCGQLTCLAFATRLLSGENALADCLPLAEAENSERFNALQGLLG